jgi:hypothetical protein
VSTLAPALEDDFPALALAEAAFRVAASPKVVRRRLQALDARVDGRASAYWRTQDVPSSYRAFARQVGLDPDVDADPLGDLVRARLGLRGTLPSAGPVPDACAIALLETGVPVWGADARALVGPLRVEVAPDLLFFVGDGQTTVAELFGPVAPEVAPARSTTEARLFALVVPGVAEATVREALWVAGRALAPDA